MILPQWPVQEKVGALTSTRLGGYSKSPFDTFNLAVHVGDCVEDVKSNRKLLAKSLPAEPIWINQVHGSHVHRVDAHTELDETCSADALYTRLRKQPLAIMTADCLPILLASRQGDEVAAIHAGWRPLAGGIIENTLQCFRAPANEIVAWFGPAIGPTAFEVGAEVKDAFIEKLPAQTQAFTPNGGNKFLADIFLLARIRLNSLNINYIYSDELCTYSDSEQFFSYRREGQCGRMATVIWRK
ncbi:peptidoglycan editing factor PgeF [Pseudoalteromonas luteoviolacea]|uniref:peptidoglycan editing factor PgeF n=1 Tax=Pseudoalteromonas luteoviolacea TaxID=43657 RepID=UPI001F29C253|nr:peptidoglycan editing factor PgeF [Pseudoalteromonas luteoviolacea]MCF6438275.1 peptidoglycan editing factor PgeF [Pseudoalteromonas luteoviolacea]